MGSPDIQFDRPVTCGSSFGNGARVAPDRGRVHGRRVSRYVITLRASSRGRRESEWMDRILRDEKEKKPPIRHTRDTYYV